jgi:predicted 2-oxoglutarate/Fe(II)-dependent dioxygenase YbiX
MSAVQPSDFANYAFAGNALDERDAGRLIALCDSQGEEGKIAHSTIAPSVRRSNVAWVPQTPEYEDLYAHVWNVGQGFNARYFGFDLKGFDSTMQVARYDAAREGGYDWHTDFTLITQARKLSLSIQLSPPDAYEGGELEFEIGTTRVPAGRDFGLAIAFPSYIRHRVAPVTKGVRYSLVAWLSGPRFR